jgi:hypothetical protein
MQNLAKEINKNANVINLEDLGCASKVEGLPTSPSCGWHKFRTSKCALVTAKALAKWVTTYTEILSGGMYCPTRMNVLTHRYGPSNSLLCQSGRR